MKSLLAGMTTRSVLLGPSVQGSAANVARCARGQRWIWDGVTFEIVHPDPVASVSNDNDSSCVLRVSGPGGRALLTGDIEAAAEEEIVSRAPYPAEVVTIPHHGSRSSSTAAFVAAIRPQLALVSAGYGNRWSFPKNEVVERWRVAGAEIASTIESGAIVVTLQPGRPPAVQHFRRERRRYWSSR
jgi:competence protein ComEC